MRVGVQRCIVSLQVIFFLMNVNYNSESEFFSLNRRRFLSSEKRESVFLFYFSYLFFFFSFVLMSQLVSISRFFFLRISSHQWKKRKSREDECQIFLLLKAHFNFILISSFHPSKPSSKFISEWPPRRCHRIIFSTEININCWACFRCFFPIQ